VNKLVESLTADNVKKLICLNISSKSVNQE